jgi:hypothetical protein
MPHIKRAAVNHGGRADLAGTFVHHEGSMSDLWRYTAPDYIVIVTVTSGGRGTWSDTGSFVVCPCRGDDECNGDSAEQRADGDGQAIPNYSCITQPSSPIGGTFWADGVDEARLVQRVDLKRTVLHTNSVPDYRTGHHTAVRRLGC